MIRHRLRPLHLLLALSGLVLFDTGFAQSQPTPLIGARFGGNPLGGDTAAAFSLGVRASDSSEFLTQARMGEVVRVTGVVRPLPEHFGLQADIYFVDRINTIFYMRNSVGTFVPWNGRVPELSPYLENVTLSAATPVELFTGKLGTNGDHRLFLGYRPAGGTLYYTPIPFPLTVRVAPEDMNWTKTGGPPGGIGYDVRMQLDQPNRMYATDTFSGVNTSDNNGITWYTSNNGITARAGASSDAIPVFTLSVDPSTPSTLWAGTRNSRGLYKSTDSGLNWNLKTQGIVENSITFRGVTVDPKNPNIVYAAAEVPSLEYAGRNLMGLRFTKSRGVVYKSTNSGNTWTAVWRGDALARYVLIDPRDSNVVYVSTGFFDVEADNADAVTLAPGGVGVIKSTDGGATWTALGRAAGFSDLYIGTLAMNPQDPSNLIAGSSADNAYTHNGQDAGIYVTFNAGLSWARGLSMVTAGNSTINSMVTAVAFAPSDGRIAYAAQPNRFLRSADSGRTWSVMAGVANGQVSSYGPPGLRAGMPVSLQVDPRNPNRVFQNNYTGGNFLTEDGGVTWTLASTGYTGAEMRAIAIDPTNPNRVFSSGRPGFFRSDDRGDTWTGLNRQDGSDELLQTPITLAVDPSQAGLMLLADVNAGTIFRSTDGGATRNLVFRQQGLNTSSDYANRHGFQAIAFAPSNPGIVYAGMHWNQDGFSLSPARASYGIAKSLDRGLTWNYVNDQTMTGKNVNAIAVDPCNANKAFAGTIEAGVLITEDGGQSWTARNTGLPSLDVRSLAIDPANTNVLYAGLENGGVWRSADGGVTWTSKGLGLRYQGSVRSLVINPVYPDVIYAAEPGSGVYRSTNEGGLWIPITQGLTTRAVYSLAIARSGNLIWAATDGEGVFRLTDSCGTAGTDCGIDTLPTAGAFCPQ
jgi:hypothetical protein